MSSDRLEGDVDDRPSKEALAIVERLRYRLHGETDRAKVDKALARLFDRYRERISELERQIAAPSPQTVEALAAKFHEIYQQEAKRQGDVRHKDAYADLPENVKEFDRVLARYVMTMQSPRAELEARLNEHKIDCRDCLGDVPCLRRAELEAAIQALEGK